MRKNCKHARVSGHYEKTRRQVPRTVGRINDQPNFGANATKLNATVACFLNHVIQHATLLIESILIAPDTNAVNKQNRQAGRTGKSLYGNSTVIMPAYV